jgi:hypothetical protein
LTLWLSKMAALGHKRPALADAFLDVQHTVDLFP